MKNIWYERSTPVSVLTILLALWLPVAPADDLWKALIGGKPDLYLRYRFEAVDDGQKPVLENAYANTLRTALGYSTNLYHGFGAYVQMEDVHVLGDDDFNNGGSNRATTRAVVGDPEGTELQQASLRYRGLPRTQLWLGRQELEHRAAASLCRKHLVASELADVRCSAHGQRIDSGYQD